MIFIYDPDGEPDIPDDCGAALVCATASCVSVGTLAEMDGETTIRLAAAFDDPEGVIVFDGEIETPGRRLIVIDSGASPLLVMNTPNAVTRLTIWANDGREPDLIMVRAQ